jgi:hypothetical protein
MFDETPMVGARDDGGGLCDKDMVVDRQSLLSSIERLVNGRIRALIAFVDAVFVLSKKREIVKVDLGFGDGRESPRIRGETRGIDTAQGGNSGKL